MRENDLTGKHFGVIEVLRRVENFEGESDSRSQYSCKCNNCGKVFSTVARNLTRRPNREGCKYCVDYCNKKGFKFGRNLNGFIDRSVVVEQGEN